MSLPFKRVSMLGTNQLLWWMDMNSGMYMDEIQSEQLEGIAKNLLIGDKFKSVTTYQIEQ